jgi:hypothetical protein
VAFHQEHQRKPWKLLDNVGLNLQKPGISRCKAGTYPNIPNALKESIGSFGSPKKGEAGNELATDSEKSKSLKTDFTDTLKASF